MNFEEQVIGELKQLKANATAYQIGKELSVGKTTIYRLFKDFKVNEFQFETVAKLVDYGRKVAKEKAENDLGADVMFQYRNERVWLLHQIVAQPLVWLDEVTCSYITKPTEVESYLAQPDISPREMEYSLFPYVPTLNNKDIKKGHEYIAEFATNFELDTNEVKVRLTVSELRPNIDVVEKHVVMSEDVYTIKVARTNIEEFKEELTYLASLVRRYMASILTEKSNNFVGYSYYVVQEQELAAPRYNVKKAHDAKQTAMCYVESLYTAKEDVFYELEELLKGKPYSVSAHYAYERLNGISSDVTEFIPTIEVIRMGARLQMFLKHYNSYGYPVATQLLSTTWYNEENVQRFKGMAVHFATQTAEHYREIEELDETYMFQAVQLKLYV